jgi:hypothetical protein
MKNIGTAGERLTPEKSNSASWFLHKILVIQTHILPSKVKDPRVPYIPVSCISPPPISAHC